MMKKNKNSTLKPVSVLLFMLSCMAVLAALCLIMPKTSEVAGNEIRSPQLREVLELEGAIEPEELDEALSDTLPEEVAAVPEVAMIKELVKEQKEEEVEKPEEVYDVDLIDTRIFLTDFYDACQQAESVPVRVVHYGDSQLEEDRLTTQLRRALQAKYGGGGVGMIPLHQTVGTRTVYQTTTLNGTVQSAGQGPKRYLVFGPKSFRRNTPTYGPMGQVAVMDDSLVVGSEHITLQASTGKQRNSESYFNRVRVLTQGDIDIQVANSIGRDGNLFLMPDSTTRATVTLQGKGDVYGVCLETDKGVTVDNVPMRGCAGTVFTGIAAKELKNYFKQTNTRLIILQYGGNVIPYTKSRKQVDQYVERMRTQIHYMKQMAPECSFLFIGPSDMVERKDGEIRTYAMIPVMDNALMEMAIEEEIGYFSLFRSMGGAGSMVKWHQQGLAGGDYIHFSRKGADKAGNLLADWITQWIF